MTAALLQNSPVDMDRIWDATGGDQEFLKELVEVFLDDAQLRIEELKTAVESRDGRELSRTAHKLKGSSANLGANGLWDLAKELEHLSAAGSISSAEPLMAALEHELARVRERLTEIVRE